MTAGSASGAGKRSAEARNDGPAAASRAQSMPEGPLLIAIDGPAGSGKSTLARALAGRFGLTHIDTGAMYRALALKAISTGVGLDDAGGLEDLLAGTQIELDGKQVILDGKDVKGEIRSRDVSSAASRIAQMPQVRRWCVERQRQMANRHPKGAVVEGRDIGTVVLPDAHLKIFLTADLDERAGRRALESGSDSAETLQKVRNRDQRDTERKASPLVAAKDAIVVDTTGHSAEKILEQVSRLVEEMRKTAEGRQSPI